MMTIIGENMH